MNNTVYAIMPEHALLVPFDLEAARNGGGGHDMLADLEGMIKAGKADTLTLANGNRLLTAQDAIGLIDSDERKANAAEVGYFAWAKVAYTPDNAPAGGTITSRDTDDVLEIVGPALVVGPDTEGDGTFTPCTMPELEIRGHVAWSEPAVLGAAIRKLLADKLPGLIGDNDNDDAEEMAAIRAGLTDEELVDCGCPDCMDALKERAAKSGGSKAVN